MTRARELANFADNTAGLETLTVSDITDLSVSASNINSATNQITDSSTDLNVDSNTLVVDKSANRVGVGTSAPASHRLEVRANAGGTSETDTIVGITNGDDSTLSDALLNIKNAGNRGTKKGHGSGSSLIKAQFSDATAFEVNKDGNVGIGDTSPNEKLVVSDNTASQFASVIKNTHASGAGMKVFGGNGTQYSFIVRDYTDNNNSLVVLGNGNVGIGKLPSTPLHIYKTGLADASTTALLTIDGKFVSNTIDSSDAVGIAFRTENALGGSQTTTCIASSYSASYNHLLLQPAGGNVGISETNPDCKVVILHSGNDSLRLKTTGGHGTKPRIYFDSGLSGTNYADKARIEGGYDSGTGGQGGYLAFRTKDTSEASQTRMTIDSSGNIAPGADNSQNLGSSSLRWNNLYVGDIRLSNEGTEGNKVDGTTGSWVIQEGEDDLYLLNSKNGKKYKFNISEV